MKIRIYGLCNVFYDAFYIEGLINYFETKEVTFEIDSFPKFGEGVFAAIIEEDKISTRIIIDSKDSDDINEMQLSWCNVYGKVNLNKNTNSVKVIPIGPSFGIKIWNLQQTIFYAITNYIKFHKSVKNKKEFLSNYWRQYKRLPLIDYQNKKKSSNNEVFFTGSLWKKESITNAMRAAFIIAMKKNELIKFEGGFAPRKNNDNFGYDDLVIEKRYSLQDYIDKMKNSAMTFNTPAVLSCHGWKLGEFLALGKAIISNKHINVLPGPLEEGIHIIYAENSDELNKKINLILYDLKLKETLELNASNYFNEYLHPTKVIKKIIIHSKL